MHIEVIGKNLFDPFKICHNSNKDGFYVGDENRVYYKNTSGEYQRIHFGRFDVIPNSYITVSVSLTKLAIALYELDNTENVVKQNWVGGNPRTTIRLQNETVSFIIVISSNKFVEKVESDVKIQVEYGKHATKYNQYYSKEYEFEADKNQYLLPVTILQEEKNTILLKNDGDCVLNVEYSTKNSTIEKIYHEIYRIKNNIDTIEKRMIRDR